MSLIFKGIYGLFMMRLVNNSVTLFVSYYPVGGGLPFFTGSAKTLID